MLGTRARLFAGARRQFPAALLARPERRSPYARFWTGDDAVTVIWMRQEERSVRSAVNPCTVSKHPSFPEM